jgi:tetratricopeptide (TPR) repeat protein
MSRLFRPTLAAALLAMLALAGCRTAVREGSPHGEVRAQNAAVARRAAAHAHYAAAIIHGLNERPTEAFREFHLAAQADPQDEELLRDVSSRLIEGRQFDLALEVLAWLTALPEPPDIAYVRLGFVYSQLGQYEKSIEANQIAIRRQPRFLPVRQNLFLNYLQTQRPVAALQVLDEAAAEPGTDTEFRINLAELYVNLGRQYPDQAGAARQRALDVLKRAAPGVATNTPLQLKLADGFNLLGNAEGAIKAYLNLLNQDSLAGPLRDILRAKLVDLFLRGNERARAIEQLHEIIRETPENSMAHYFLGSIAFDEKRWNDAVDCFQRALLFNPSFEPVQYDLASAQIAAGRGADAVKTLTTVQQKFPVGFVSEYLLGMAYHEQKKYADALNHLTAAEAIARVSETNRLNAGLYFQLGVAAERVGDRAAAVQYFEKCLALAPDNADALNYLGYMWAEKGEHLDRARTMIERAVKLEPDNAAFLDSLGWVLYQLGKPREARDYLLQAIAKTEEPDPTLYDHLGDACAALKEMDKAREAWAKSLMLESNETIRKKLGDSPSP